jgi:sarcosine oxidase subunit delta
MRIKCPLCGERDMREFHYRGASDYMHRPAGDAAPEAWDAYLHLRDNPAGPLDELWSHDFGCRAWVLVTRNTVTHEILSTELAADAAAKAQEGR